MMAVFPCPLWRWFVTTLVVLLVQSGQYPACANPNTTTATVAQGTSAFSTSGSHLTITTSANALINWQSFNIAAGETTTFVQPSSSSVVWNQINDSNPSQILGNLNANGYVVLQNQSGFYIGGQASISTHGLLMTTAQLQSPNVFGSGAWQFNAPPPTAQIINYGQINIAGGGSVFLIASDIENKNDPILGTGTISAPGGNIGLYAGQQVLISSSPDGRGLSTHVTLPQGSVDNEGKLIADAGSIAMQAKTVNQGGLLQANSVQNVNGTIELLANDSVTLGAGSVVSAQGDITGISSGGTVSIQSGNTFSDQAGSIINVAGGAHGGGGGQIVISAPQMSTPLSTLTGQATAGYANGSLTLGADNILVNSDGSPSANTLVLKDGSVSGWSTAFSQISLDAAYDLTMSVGTKITCDAGRINLNAATVDLSGTLQANSINQANGVIEVNASDSLTLESSSDIEAHGDNSSASASPGGFVVLHAGNTFADNAGSQINVAGGTGLAGGQAGIVEIFGNNIVDASSIKSTIGNNYAVLINTYDLTLSGNPTDTSTASPNLNVNDLAAYTQIDLHALNNIDLNSIFIPDPGDPSQTIPAPWSLADSTTPAKLSLQAGNNLILDDQSGILAGHNWSLNLMAGSALPAGTQPASGNDGIYLYGDAYIQTLNGNINLWAANEVQVGGGDIGGITTSGGGNITVTAQYGDVNTGNNINGYDFGLVNAPYYAVDYYLGGISTAAGGNVSIAAGGNVISFLPIQTGNPNDYVNARNDAGSGAFGPQPGNVTITAGGNVYGHYVVANGAGSISAGGDIGAPTSTLLNNPSEGFALSLVKGNWNIYAPFGSIYVQDVRNPNGVFGEYPGSSANNYTGYHVFDYDPSASLLLEAGDTVEITGFEAPHFPPSNLAASIPILFPPGLDVIAGSGGFILDTSVILFPSPNQNLNIVTENGGNFGIPNSPNNIDAYTTTPVMLEMSDSSARRWVGNSSFQPADQPDSPAELLNLNPVTLSISGNMNAVNLYTTKVTDIAVGGDMINSGFVGMNLHASDVTSIKVQGQIFYSPVYTFASLNAPITSANPLQPNFWDSIFYSALNPSLISQLATLQANDPNVIGSGGLFFYLKNNNYLLFPDGDLNSKFTLGANPGFVYDAATLQLGFAGKLSALTAQQLATLQGGTVTVLVTDANGNPLFDASGHLQTTTYNFSANFCTASTLNTLYNESLISTAAGASGLGLQIGGPGALVVHAGSINLGNSQGIGSVGFGNGGLTAGGFDYSSLKSLLPVAAEGGASVSVSVDGILSMATSGIFSRDGGDVTVNAGGQIDLSQGTFVFPTYDCYGIWTSGHSDVSVTANGNINIGSSRIATFNGGNVFIESENGDVNAGTGVNLALAVYGFIDNPVTGTPSFAIFGDVSANPSPANPAFYGSGVLAEYPIPRFQSSGGKKQPGNITILTPNGNITSSLGGISQFAVNQTVSGNPLVTMIAGTDGVDYIKNQQGMEWNGKFYLPGTLLGLMVGGNFKPEDNIALGQGGVVGGIVNISAGNVQGLIIAHQDVNIKTTESFNGTVLSSGSANFSGGGSVSGTVVGIGGINVTGGGAVTATLLSQNVSVGADPSQSTLGKSATATATSTSAAGESNGENKQLASTNTNDDEDKKQKIKPSLSRHLKRVTVILPRAI